LIKYDLSSCDKLSKTNLNVGFVISPLFVLLIRMDQIPSTKTQTCTVQNATLDTVMDILNKYSDLYTETPQTIYKYFELMLNDQKPAISIEIYGRPQDRVRELKRSLERFFFVFGEYDDTGQFPSFHLSVSKVKSIARYVDIIQKEGFAQNAGTIGLLLGYQFNEVVNYIQTKREDEFRD
jgi:hypothetical protein